MYDEAGILTSEEVSRLEAQADEVEQERGFSVNIVTVDDYKDIRPRRCSTPPSPSTKSSRSTETTVRASCCCSR